MVHSVQELPPGVAGKIQGYVVLAVDQILWASKPRKVAVSVQWWGGNAVHFFTPKRVKLAEDYKIPKQLPARVAAKYPVRCQPITLFQYFRDMDENFGGLIVQILDEELLKYGAENALLGSVTIRVSSCSQGHINGWHRVDPIAATGRLADVHVILLSNFKEGVDPGTGSKQNKSCPPRIQVTGAPNGAPNGDSTATTMHVSAHDDEIPPEGRSFIRMEQLAATDPSLQLYPSPHKPPTQSRVSSVSISHSHSTSTASASPFGNANAVFASGNVFGDDNAEKKEGGDGGSKSKSTTTHPPPDTSPSTSPSSQPSVETEVKVTVPVKVKGKAKEVAKPVSQSQQQGVAGKTSSVEREGEGENENQVAVTGSVLDDLLRQGHALREKMIAAEQDSGGDGDNEAMEMAYGNDRERERATNEYSSSHVPLWSPTRLIGMAEAPISAKDILNYDEDEGGGEGGGAGVGESAHPFAALRICFLPSAVNDHGYGDDRLRERHTHSHSQKSNSNSNVKPMIVWRFSSKHSKSSAASESSASSSSASASNGSNVILCNIGRKGGVWATTSPLTSQSVHLYTGHTIMEVWKKNSLVGLVRVEPLDGMLSAAAEPDRLYEKRPIVMSCEWNITNPYSMAVSGSLQGLMVVGNVKQCEMFMNEMYAVTQISRVWRGYRVRSEEGRKEEQRERQRQKEKEKEAQIIQEDANASTNVVRMPSVPMIPSTPTAVTTTTNEAVNVNTNMNTSKLFSPGAVWTNSRQQQQQQHSENVNVHDGDVTTTSVSGGSFALLTIHSVVGLQSASEVLVPRKPFMRLASRFGLNAWVKVEIEGGGEGEDSGLETSVIARSFCPDFNQSIVISLKSLDTTHTKPSLPTLKLSVFHRVPRSVNEMNTMGSSSNVGAVSKSNDVLVGIGRWPLKQSIFDHDDVHTADSHSGIQSLALPEANANTNANVHSVPLHATDGDGEGELVGAIKLNAKILCKNPSIQTALEKEANGFESEGFEKRRSRREDWRGNASIYVVAGKFVYNVDVDSSKGEVVQPHQRKFYLSYTMHGGNHITTPSSTPSSPNTNVVLFDHVSTTDCVCDAKFEEHVTSGKTEIALWEETPHYLPDVLIGTASAEMYGILDAALSSSEMHEGWVYRVLPVISKDEKRVSGKLYIKLRLVKMVEREGSVSTLQSTVTSASISTMTTSSSTSTGSDVDLECEPEREGEGEGEEGEGGEGEEEEGTAVVEPVTDHEHALDDTGGRMEEEEEEKGEEEGEEEERGEEEEEEEEKEEMPTHEKDEEHVYVDQVTGEGEGEVEGEPIQIDLSIISGMRLPEVNTKSGGEGEGDHIIPGTTHIRYQWREGYAKTTTNYASNDIFPLWEHTQTINDFAAPPLWRFLRNGSVVFEVCRLSESESGGKDEGQGEGEGENEHVRHTTVIGSVYVPLSVLLTSLTELSGWYSVVDYSNNIKGHIQIAIKANKPVLPKEITGSLLRSILEAPKPISSIPASVSVSNPISPSIQVGAADRLATLREAWDHEISLAKTRSPVVEGTYMDPRDILRRLASATDDDSDVVLRFKSKKEKEGEGEGKEGDSEKIDTISPHQTTLDGFLESIITTTTNVGARRQLYMNDAEGEISAENMRRQREREREQKEREVAHMIAEQKKKEEEEVLIRVEAERAAAAELAAEELRLAYAAGLESMWDRAQKEADERREKAASASAVSQAPPQTPDRHDVSRDRLLREYRVRVRSPGVTWDKETKRIYSIMIGK